jgi:hypothetical protein
MIFLSHNCRGLDNPTKIMAIQRLIEIHKPNLIFLQEMMMEGDTVVKLLSSSLQDGTS